MAEAQASPVEEKLENAVAEENIENTTTNENGNGEEKVPEKVPEATKPVDKQPKKIKDDKQKKKDDKSVDHVLKALNSLNTPEEKLAAICKKYAELVNDHRTQTGLKKQAEKRLSVLQREKDQLQSDLSKAILTRSRLENVCRELHRQNKAIKDENHLRIREEEEKRKEMSNKFQSTLSEITQMMQQNNDKNMKLRDDNIDMTAKLKNVYEQYERREQHVEKLAKQLQLEVQLAEAKLAKAKMEISLEKETYLKEKQELLKENCEYKTQIAELQTNEIGLREQINMYHHKYDEFHKTLMHSNDAITNFKSEMERMSKQIWKLEKETTGWKSRYELSHNTLLKMTDEKLKADQELAAANRKIAALQNLCRSLQQEIVRLRGDLKQARGETEENSGNNAKINKMMDEANSQLESSSEPPAVSNGLEDNKVCPMSAKAAPVTSTDTPSSISTDSTETSNESAPPKSEEPISQSDPVVTESTSNHQPVAQDDLQKNDYEQITQLLEKMFMGQPVNHNCIPPSVLKVLSKTSSSSDPASNHSPNSEEDDKIVQLIQKVFKEHGQGVNHGSCPATATDSTDSESNSERLAAGQGDGLQNIDQEKLMHILQRMLEQKPADVSCPAPVKELPTNATLPTKPVVSDKPQNKHKKKSKNK